MLNPKQFTQLELAGMPEALERVPSRLDVYKPSPHITQEFSDHVTGVEAALAMHQVRSKPEYVTAHTHGTHQRNPLFDERGTGDVVPDRVGEAVPEFVPTWQMRSGQHFVNDSAVDAQVEHADPLRLDEDPFVYEATDGDGYVIQDGNHRILAAQRRGQLLMPANVYRQVGG